MHDQPERVQVALRPHRRAADLLRGHVGGGAQKRSGAGEPGQLRVVEHGQPEVQDLDRAVPAEHEVGRFEVAVQDAASVRGGQDRGDLRGGGGHPGEGDVLVLVDDVVQRDALDELHHHERAGADTRIVEDADVVDGGRPRVLQAGHDARLVQEAFDQRLVVLTEREPDDLDGDPAVQSAVVGAVDLPHAALADRHRFQFVPVVDDRPLRHHATFPWGHTWGKGTPCRRTGRFRDTGGPDSGSGLRRGRRCAVRPGERLGGALRPVVSRTGRPG